MTDRTEAPETQLERTRMAWRRTMVGVIGVAGLGGIKLLIDHRHHEYLGVFVGIVGLAAILPISHRLRLLRSGDRAAATWQPLALTSGLVVLAVALILVT